MSYRETALSCPACGEALEPRNVGEALIDVCPGCGGIWVDWFDGDLGAMVRGAPVTTGGDPVVAGDVAPGARGRAACPRCNVPLAADRHQESSAAIERCAECAGAFVPRDAARVIASSGPAPEPREDGWGRLAAVLKRWFGWDEQR